jgi:hypothetical protein
MQYLNHVLGAIRRVRTNVQFSVYNIITSKQLDLDLRQGFNSSRRDFPCYFTLFVHVRYLIIGRPKKVTIAVFARCGPCVRGRRKEKFRPLL